MAEHPAHRAAPPPDPRPQEESPFRQFLGIAQKVFLFWLVSQIATKFTSQWMNPKAPPSPSAVSPGRVQQAAPGQPDPLRIPPVSAHPAWPLGITVSMHVYLSTSPSGDVFSGKWISGWRKDQDAGLPSFVWDNITFGDWAESRSSDFHVKFPETVLQNGPLWADIFLVKEGASPDPSSPQHDSSAVHHVRKLLSRYQSKVKIRKEKSLLGGREEPLVEIDEEPEPDILVSHWHSNLTLTLISDANVVPIAQLPPPLAEHVHLVPNERDATGTQGFYKPIIFPNDFWHLKSQLVEINSTTPCLPLHVTFEPMSYWKFQLYATLGHGFNEAAKQQGASGGAELDEIKRMLVETNPWFLGLTALVSVLHMVFEMLAFSSDVSHWRKQKELIGVSVRTIVTNVFVQIVILLYLLDNNSETSWMIIFTQGTGILVEAWKVTKAVDINLVAASPGSVLPYKIEVKDKHVLNEDEKRTQEYDKLAFRYVAYVAIPLLGAYTIYSLIYETHRGWYSFIISTLTSFVYMFGFAQLIPQLIINYKLKSVAHMPMKAMIYKTLSTVVDDFFAFCIKMPILHRLACFRDDVVFLIFLYQRWIYRIDPKRVNEFGQVLGGKIDGDLNPGETADGTAETKKDK